MIRLEEIKELYNFEPKHTFAQFQQNLPQEFKTQTAQDSRLYKAVRQLTEQAYPSIKNPYDKRWINFYLPLKKKGYFILVPIGIVLYDKKFFLCFPHSEVEVQQGKEKNDFYLSLIKQILEFSRILKKNPGIVMKALPYDIRTGQVLGKYVLENLLPCNTKEKMLKLYRSHINKTVKKSRGVSLNNYLNTAAICYMAAFGNKTDNLSAEQMYRKWADNRDCGMLKIRNKKSAKDFSHWLDNESHCGGHPFEIVFSWHDQGILLVPPSTDRPYFILKVTDYRYAMPFLEMVKALIRNRIPFKAHGLESVVDYLCGESYFIVNAYGKHNISYPSGDKKLFKHITWDEPEMLKWKCEGL